MQEQRLNKIERYKSELPPADFSPEKIDWSNIDERIRFYLKNYGLYNSKLREQSWMIRLRFDGGLITPEALSIVAQIAKRERARALLTARAQIEIHDLSVKRVLPVWHELKAASLQSCQVLSDNFRAILLDPLDGIASDSKIACTEILNQIQKEIVGNPKYIGTIPRKFNSAVIGRELPSFNPWGNDLLLALAHNGAHWGFNLYLGGKNSHCAQDANIFCQPENAAMLFEAVARVYKREGLRGSRSKTRLFHLIEKVGMAQIRAWIEEEMRAPLEQAGVLRMQSSSQNLDHLLPIKRYGKHGEITLEELEEAAKDAQRQKLTLRLTPLQELWAFDSNEIRQSSSINRAKSIQDAQEKNPLGSQPSTKSIGMITACAGERYCPLSLWDIKDDISLLPIDRLKMLGISLGFSGCLKGCGRHYHSDIGLIGLRTNLYADTERAARVFIGALQSPKPAAARMLYYSVPLRKLQELLDVIIEDYERSDTKSFEEFSRNILARYSIETLQLWFIVRQLYSLSDKIIKSFYLGDESRLLKELDSLTDMPKSSDLYEKIKILSHRLWDLEPSL